MQPRAEGARRIGSYTRRLLRLGEIRFTPVDVYGVRNRRMTPSPGAPRSKGVGPGIAGQPFGQGGGLTNGGCRGRGAAYGIRSRMIEVQLQRELSGRAAVADRGYTERPPEAELP